MPSIGDLQFDTLDWRVVTAHAHEVRWTTPAGDTVVLSFEEGPAELPGPITQIDAVRDYYRPLVASEGGGLISVDTVMADETPAVEFLFKYRVTPTERALKYVGGLGFFFADCSAVITTESREQGLIGIRESAAFTEFRQSRGAEASVPQTEWARDPYNPSFEGPLMRNPADDPRWDEVFPQHPLTTVRGILKHLQSSVRLLPALKSLQRHGR